MLSVSQQYSDMIYDTLYARYFTPKVFVKVIDIAAQPNCEYSTSDGTSFSSIAQLNNNELISGNIYGTLQDYEFLLDSSKYVRPIDAVGEFGFVSEELSDENGDFTTPVSLTVQYDQLVTVQGRTLVFDDKYDAIPTVVSMSFYNDEELVAEVTSDTSSTLEEPLQPEAYMLTMAANVFNYDKVIITVTKMSKPYRQLRIIEDLPGIVLSYYRNNIDSIMYTQRVDLLSETIEDSEADITVENVQKYLKILNPEGIEKSLRRGQPVDYYLSLVFPNNKQEEITVLKGALYEWRSEKGALTARFIVRDTFSKLSKNYIRGLFPAVPVSLYELAVDVFDYAGVTDYEIDNRLQTIFTSTCLPYASCKECLRLIAQAGRCVVIAAPSGRVCIKYIGMPETFESIDTLDYSIIFEAPQITTDKHVKAVSIDVFRYSIDSETSTIAEDIYTLNGEETIIIDYSTAKDCTVQVFSVDQDGEATPTNTASLLSSSVYSNAAELTISANSDVKVIITGTRVEVKNNKVKKNNSAINTVDDAEEINISNKLITSNIVAQDVTEYALYWYNKVYLYDFDWRQNPALELLDFVKVYDDFNINNNVVVLSRQLNFVGGTLEGNTTAKC